MDISSLAAAAGTFPDLASAAAYCERHQIPFSWLYKSRKGIRLRKPEPKKKKKKPAPTGQAGFDFGRAAEARAYAGKQAAKLERLKSRAAKKQAEAAALFERSRAATQHIPMGQPILVGHHSEKKHRGAIKRSDAAMRKHIKATKEADRLAARARAVEASTAVSSDDPEAVKQIKQKIADLEKSNARNKQINAAMRAAKREAKKTGRDELDIATEKLAAIGVGASLVAAIMEPDFAGRMGVPSYRLKNTSAEIRRLKKRLEQIANTEQQEGREQTIGGVHVIQEDNRVRIHFPGKPDEATRAKLKGEGFRWARSEGAWQRHASERAWWLAEQIARAYES